MAEHFATVDDYVASLPDDARDVLERIRATVRTALPGAGETIRYNMPTVTYDGEYVIHVAAWKNHIGLYPMPVLDGDLEAEIAPVAGRHGLGPLPARLRRRPRRDAAGAAARRRAGGDRQ